MGRRERQIMDRMAGRRATPPAGSFSIWKVCYFAFFALAAVLLVLFLLFSPYGGLL